MSGDDTVPNGDLRMTVLWGGVGCPDRAENEGKRRTVVSELGHLVPHWWSTMTTRLTCTVMEIRGLKLKDIGVTTLTFWGHVTSLVTWLLDPLTLITLP